MYRDIGNSNIKKKKKKFTLSITNKGEFRPKSIHSDKSGLFIILNDTNNLQIT